MPSSTRKPAVIVTGVHLETSMVTPISSAAPITLANPHWTPCRHYSPSLRRISFMASLSKETEEEERMVRLVLWTGPTGTKLPPSGLASSDRHFDRVPFDE